MRLAFRAVGREGSRWTERMAWGAIRSVGILLALVIVSLAVMSVSADLSALHPVQGELAPDLVPASATVIPSLARVGDILRVSVAVANRGAGPATSATVGLIDTRPNGDVVPIGRTPLSGPLAPGTSVLVETPHFVAAGAGEHTLMIRVEDVMPDDANRENDVLTIRLTIQPPIVVPPPSPSAGGLRIAIIEDLRFVGFVGVAVVALFVVVVLLPPRRREPLEAVPPPPDPPDRIPPPIWPP
ncbi:MAG: CARDB domain-containing protein [Thermoplasmata archaeon]